MGASTSAPPPCHDSISDKKHGVTVSTEEKFSPASSSSELGVLERGMDHCDIEKNQAKQATTCFNSIWAEVGFIGSLLICLSMAVSYLNDQSIADFLIFSLRISS